MFKRLMMVMLACLTIGVQAFAQTSVSGKVTDAQGEALPGVNVLIKGTNTGAMTDLTGAYKLSGVSAKSVLVFSSIGYASQEVTVGNRAVINVTLAEDAEFLDDVVVVAYGTARKKDLTGSLAAVDGSAIADQAQGSVTRMLEGQVAGLQTSAITGQPGIDIGIRVRGIGTTSSNNANALIVVDGVPATEGTNPLTSINPNDIESLTVLKDAASTALYGSRGANGVILVTTKGGKSGKTTVSFEGRWGINAIGPNSHFAKIGDGGSGELYEFYWESIYNSAYYGKDSALSAYKGDATKSAEFASQHLFNYTGKGETWGRNGLGNHMQYNVPGATYTATGSGSTASSTMTGAYLVGTDGKLNSNAELKWAGETIEEALVSNRFRQEYNVAANGGTDKVDFHVSLGYLSDPSYVATSSFDRYTARANVNAQITSWLKAGAKFAYTHRKTNILATRWNNHNPGYTMENPFSRVDVSGVLDLAYAVDKDGNYVTDDAGNRLAATTDPSAATVKTANSYSPLGSTTSTWGNYDLMAYYKQQENSSTYDDLNTSGYLRASFLKYFTAEVNLAYNANFRQDCRYFNAETAANRIGKTLGSAIHKDRYNYGTLNTQQLINFNRNIGKHHVDAMIGHEYYQYNMEKMSYGSAHSLINGFQGYVNFLGLQSYGTFGTSWGGGMDKMAMEGYLGRANYIYDDKYYVSASIRRDGSSKFKTNDVRWGTFWSVGAGWRISSEPWMEGAKGWLDNLKIRASYGVIGNQNGVSMYNYQTWSYGVGSWAGSGTSTYPTAYTLKKNGWVNEALTWEHVHTTDAGLDFTLFGGKVSGSFDWYNKQTVDAMFNQNVSYLAAGQATLKMNNAGIRNRGIELELSYQPIKTADWDLIFSTNGTHYNTVLTSLPEGAGSASLNGCYTASADGWTIQGETGSSGNEYLRGVGKDYFNMYLYKYGGVAGNPGVTYYGKDGKAYTGYSKGDPDAGMPLFYHKVTEAEAKAGKYGSAKEGESILSTATPTSADRYECGDALPEWIGGFTTKVRYKGLDLGVVFTYQIGGKFFSVDYASGESGKYMAGNNIAQPASVSRELLGNTWSENNQSAKYPMVYYNSPVAASGANLGSWNYTDMALFDASYFSIKNITLGYTFPKALVNKAKISNLRIFASCDNPVLVYSHSGVDPRWSITGGMGVGAYSYPYLAVYTFGVNLDF